MPRSSGDRASASGAEGRRFESYRGHNEYPRQPCWRGGIFLCRKWTISWGGLPGLDRNIVSPLLLG